MQRLLPITGVPLPLVSYGGTALIANLFALGMLPPSPGTSRPAAQPPMRPVAKLPMPARGPRTTAPAVADRVTERERVSAPAPRTAGSADRPANQPAMEARRR